MSTEPYHILLIEDNPGDARLVQEAFEMTDTETELHIVVDGVKAIDLLRKHGSQEDAVCPDFVILDLNLPRKNGFEILETIQEESSHQRIPVVVLSSSGASKDVIRSYEKHANAYLTKPTDPHDYFSLVNSIEQFWFKTAHLPPT